MAIKKRTQKLRFWDNGSDVVVGYTANGQPYLLDHSDVEMVGKRSVSVNNCGYFCVHIGGKSVGIHRLINKTPAKKHTDHINGDKSDNRRQNLRTCTRAENQQNRRRHKETLCKYKGVRTFQRGNKYGAQIRVSGQLKHLGCYETEGEAAKAYNKAALYHFGEFASLNNIGGTF